MTVLRNYSLFAELLPNHTHPLKRAWILVPGARIELARCLQHGILSPKSKLAKSDT